MLFHVRNRQISIFWWTSFRRLDCFLWWSRNTTRRRWWWLLLPSVGRHFRCWWWCWIRCCCHCVRRESWVHHYLLLWQCHLFLWEENGKKIRKVLWWEDNDRLSFLVFFLSFRFHARYKPLYWLLLTSFVARWQNLVDGFGIQYLRYRVGSRNRTLFFRLPAACACCHEIWRVLFWPFFSFEILLACRRADAPDLLAMLNSASRQRFIAELGIVKVMESLSDRNHFLTDAWTNASVLADLTKAKRQRPMIDREGLASSRLQEQRHALRSASRWCVPKHIVVVNTLLSSLLSFYPSNAERELKDVNATTS